MTRIKFMTAVLVAASCASIHAQTTSDASSSSLEQTVAAQQAQIDKLTATVNDLKNTDAGLTETVVNNQKALTDDIDSPSAIHYKGVTITPVGFFAAESVYRQRSINSDINTPFNSQLFPGAAQYYTSEFNFSARQSRLGVLAQGKLGNVNLTGYFEGDFLGSGTTSNDNQSNSYVFRQRLFFGQVALHSGLTITGGQTWSLVTETKTGVDPRSEVLPQTPDAQYVIGFSWERQPGIRVAQKFGNLTLAGSLEQTENIFSAVTPYANFFIGAPGVSGGLFNAYNGNYSNNIAPDVILKATYDSKYGHFEIGGLSRFFRDRVYPGYTGTTSVPVGTPAVNDTKFGGGFFFNAHVPMTKYFTLGVHGLQGTGVGRYGTAGLPDTTVHLDGTLEPIRATQGLLSLEFHPTPKMDIMGYAGGEYAQRTTYLYAAGKYDGYGVLNANVSGCGTEYTPTATSGYGPAGATNCSAVTRDLIEGTASVIYRFYNGPKGRVQMNVAYSYLKREAWTGTISTGVFGSPNGNNNMAFTSLRYYLP